MYGNRVISSGFNVITLTSQFGVGVKLLPIDKKHQVCRVLPLAPPAQSCCVVARLFPIVALRCTLLLNNFHLPPFFLK